MLRANVARLDGGTQARGATSFAGSCLSRIRPQRLRSCRHTLELGLLYALLVQASRTIIFVLVFVFIASPHVRRQNVGPGGPHWYTYRATVPSSAMKVLPQDGYTYRYGANPLRRQALARRRAQETKHRSSTIQIPVHNHSHGQPRAFFAALLEGPNTPYSSSAVHMRCISYVYM